MIHENIETCAIFLTLLIAVICFTIIQCTLIISRSKERVSENKVFLPDDGKAQQLGEVLCSDLDTEEQVELCKLILSTKEKN